MDTLTYRCCGMGKSMSQCGLVWTIYSFVFSNFTINEISLMLLSNSMSWKYLGNCPSWHVQRNHPRGEVQMNDSEIYCHIRPIVLPSKLSKNSDFEYFYILTTYFLLGSNLKICNSKNYYS